MSTKPNIVYILADDMGYGDMSCNNPDSKIPTPNLDRLAQGGMRFTDAHAASSVCTPSRYSILTGRYCWRTELKKSVLWEWDPPLIEPDRPTVGSFLKDNGYRTACFAKWHLGWNWPTKDGTPANGGLGQGEFNMAKRYELAKNIDFTKPVSGGPIDCGFEYYFGIDVPNFAPYTWFEQDRILNQPTEEKPKEMFGHSGPMTPGWKLEKVMPETTRRAVEYIHNSASDPFFLYFALTGPHTPVVPNKEFQGKSKAGTYGDFVCEIDWTVGEIMRALEEKGIAENTLLIFTSDNGPECIEGADGGAYKRIQNHSHYSMQHLRGVKRDTWEGGHRIPLIARWPGVTPAGSLCSQMTSLMDFFPTCADIIQEKLPESAAPDAMTMLPLLKGEEKEIRPFTIHHSCHGTFAVRKGDWVFIDAPTGDDNQEPDWFKTERGYVSHDFPGELYNLNNDIAESKNLYPDHPDIVKELKEILEKTKGNSATEPGTSLPKEKLSE